MLTPRSADAPASSTLGAWQRQPWSNIVSIALLLFPALIHTLANLHNAYDDAYITYRYAWNLASGNGFVYNVGDRFLGTTAPLYGVLLGVLGIPWPDAIPLLSSILSGLALGLTSIALYLFGRHYGKPLSGLLAGLFFAVNPLLPPTIGGEMLLQTAVIAWALLLYVWRRTLPAAALLAVALLIRPDGVLASAVVGTHFLVTRRRLPWREIAVIAAIVAPFLGAAWWYYGSPLPGTLGAKLAQRDSGLWPSFSTGVIEWIKGWTILGSSSVFPMLPAAPNAQRLIVLVVLGLPAVLLRYRFWIMPLAWSILYTLGYHVLGVPFYHWYVVPVVFGLTILAGAGAALLVDSMVWLLRRVRGWGNNALVRAAVTIAAVLALLPGMYAQLRFSVDLAAGQPDPAERIYEKAGRWLAANTSPDARVGYFEIGYLGYFARRPIVDPLGLVSPGVASHIGERQWTWAYEHVRPEYIVHNQLIFTDYIGAVRDEPWFKQQYAEVAQIAEPGYPPLIIYQRTN